MLTYEINYFNKYCFTIKYHFNNFNPFSFCFMPNCMSPFNYKKINQFVDKSIRYFEFTDNITLMRKNNKIYLTYYMYEKEYDENESMELIDVLRNSMDDIIMNKKIVALYYTSNEEYIDNIKNGNLPYFINNKIVGFTYNGKSLLYYAIYYKQYNIVEWFLSQQCKIEFQDLEFSDETSRILLYNAIQCPSHIKYFLESKMCDGPKEWGMHKRKCDPTTDDFHTKVIRS